MANLCDRCPQPAKHTVVSRGQYGAALPLRACDHHAREWAGQRPGLELWDDDVDDSGPDCA